MHRLRFRIRTLLLVMTIAAIVCIAFLPFHPHVSFSDATLDDHSDGMGGRFACYHVLIKNDGIFPIWYAGSGGQVGSFSYQGNPTESTDNLNWRSQSPMTWSILWSGRSALIHMPAHADYLEARIGLQFKDYRGRTADIWSSPFDTSKTAQ